MLDVGGVELEFPCPRCGEATRATIETVRFLPVIDCGCGETFGVCLETFAQRVSSAELAAKAARKARRRA
jgi:transcription elongation factor Elf1